MDKCLCIKFLKCNNEYIREPKIRKELHYTFLATFGEIFGRLYFYLDDFELVLNKI